MRGFRFGVHNVVSSQGFHFCFSLLLVCKALVRMLALQQILFAAVNVCEYAMSYSPQCKVTQSLDSAGCGLRRARSSLEQMDLLKFKICQGE